MPKKSTPIITAKNLKKSYRTTEAVKGVDFTVNAGTCTGLLGPNGAGKTTTMRMIMGLTKVTSGSLKLFKEDVGNLSRNTKTKVGLVPQENNLDPDLTVKQNLEVYGRYFGLDWKTIKERVPTLLEYMKLTEKTNDYVHELSGGMKRRLIIARALIADPELVILDEPTTGLDPQARVMIWQRVIELKKQGKTLLLTTHYMDEAQRLCDQIIVIDHGKILDEGTPKELIKRHVKPHVYEVMKPVPKTLKECKMEQEDIGDSVLFFTEKPEEMRKKLDKEKAHYLHRPANLEDVFLRLTGRTLRE